MYGPAGVGLPERQKNERAAASALILSSFDPYVRSLGKTKSLGLGLASVFAAAAVDALGSDLADVLVAFLGLDDGAGGTFVDALLAEGAQFRIDNIHSWVPPM